MKEKPHTVCKHCGWTIEDGSCDGAGCGGIGPPTRPSKKEWRRLQKKEDDFAKYMNNKKEKQNE